MTEPKVTLRIPLCANMACNLCAQVPEQCAYAFRPGYMRGETCSAASEHPSMFTRLRNLFTRRLAAEPATVHTAWCDSNAPPTRYGDRLECNCDPNNPNSGSAYALMAALHAFEVADAQAQQTLFGRQVLPRISRATAFDMGDEPDTPR